MAYFWEQRKLGDTIPVVTDYVAAGSFADIAANVDYKSEPDYAQLVRTVDLKHNFENNDSVYVDKNAFDYLYRVNLDEESIVLPNIGANIGEVYYIEPSELPYERNVLGPNAIYLKPNKNTKFIYSLFQTVDFQKKLAISVASSGQPKFNKTELKEILLMLPNNDEQRAIGSYFRNLDNLITLHQRKCERLQTIKKAMLEKMFPQNGSKVPEIRFAGFTDDWEQRKVGETVTEVSRPIELNDYQEYQLVTVKRRNEGIVSRGKMYGKNILVKNYFEIHAGDYLISKRQLVHGANGIVPENLDKAVVSNEYMACVSNEFVTAEFLTLLSKTKSLQRDFFLSSYGVDIEKLVFDVEDWKKRSIIIPKIEEQNKICEYFSYLDHLITLHQRQLEKLQNIKKSMLEKMFV